MQRTSPPRKVRDPGLAVSLALLALLLAVNAVAVGGILSARDGARREALNELELQTEVHARSLEASLAGLRGDLLFLSQSPPLTRTLPSPTRDDPMARRWRRLDVEGTLVLFLAAHPAVERLVVRDRDRRATAVAGRRGGAPVVLPPTAAADPPAAAEATVAGRWPLGGIGSGVAGVAGGAEGALEATVSLAAVLAEAAPGLEERLTLVRDGAVPAPGGDPFAARVPVRDDGWDPPLAATLVRHEAASSLVRSVEELAARYRTTVLLNVAVVALTLALGLLAFRQMRRAERLTAERAHEVRLRELERQLLHSERLASVGRLAAGMAHEINNPLEGMGNYLSLLDDELAAGDVDAARPLVRRVREGLERAAGILRRVLTAAESEGDARSTLDLRRPVAEAVEFVRGAGSFPGVEVRLCAPDDAVPVVGSAVTLGQLALNLLLNACQAQPQGGEVEVTVERWEGGARVAVADRGAGLPEGGERLFEPFYSTRGSTGLGLAVCHRIAREHGGAMEAADREGGGAVFTLCLPLAAETAPAADEGAPAVAAGGTAR
jgi:signal transduction histidine kinase